MITYVTFAYAGDVEHHVKKCKLKGVNYEKRQNSQPENHYL